MPKIQNDLYNAPATRNRMIENPANPRHNFQSADIGRNIAASIKNAAINITANIVPSVLGLPVGFPKMMPPVFHNCISISNQLLSHAFRSKECRLALMTTKTSYRVKAFSHMKTIATAIRAGKPDRGICFGHLPPPNTAIVPSYQLMSMAIATSGRIWSWIIVPLLVGLTICISTLLNIWCGGHWGWLS